jgi:hypothetical protein
MTTLKDDNFTLIGYVVCVDIDYSYEYYFLDDITTDIKKQMELKLKSKPNPVSKFYCNIFEVYKINNKKYLKFKTIGDEILNCIKKSNYNDTDLIVSKVEPFTIDTTIYPPYISQIKTLQDIVNFNILINDEQIDIDNVNKAIDILQSIKEEYLKNGVDNG